MTVLSWILLVWSVGASLVLLFLTWAWMKEKDDELSVGIGFIMILVLSVLWFISIPFMIVFNNRANKRL